MKKCLLFLSLFFSAVFSLNAQVVDSMMKVYADQVPDQKAYVHFDKDLYRAGETIWFKAYLFTGFSLSPQSKNFYAELIDDKGTVVQRKIYPVSESTTSGNFDIPDSLPAGNFIYRGYTTWMLNFDTSFIFTKSIPIVSKEGIADRNTSAANVAHTNLLQFFPEGGNLVSTLESLVAFKANDEFGKPVSAKGNIVDSKGKVITAFASTHDGMGTFTLVPEANETYNAIWTDAFGKQQTTPLPAAKAQGFVLKVSAVGRKKVFMLSRTDDVPADWKKVNIVAMIGQERVYKAVADLTASKVTSGAIPVEALPSGILTITIFSGGWEPIAERIVMVNNDNYAFTAKVNTTELNTNFRAKNTFEIQVEDTVLSNMSLAITDAATGRENFGDNIISRVLLTGDIKGYVNNPAYYFSNISDTLASQLDLVMLTHGWRRYNWSLLARGRKPTLKFPNESYLALNAQVFGVTTASPLRSDEQLLVFIQGRDSAVQLLQLPKVSVDKFSLPNTIFYDTVTLHYQFMKDKKAEQEMSLSFNNNFYKGSRRIDASNRPVSIIPDTSVYSRTKFLAERLSRYGSNISVTGNVLQAVTVKTTRTKSRLQELDDKYASGLFKGSDGYFFDLANEPNSGFYDIFQYLQGKVAGLQISGTGASATLSWRGSSTSLFLNEMPSDPSMLSSVSVSDIAYIKVLRPPFMGSFGGGAGGAVAVYTKKGNDVKPPPGKGLSRTIVTGYSTPKEFYSPNYKDLAASSEVTADYRSTLLWKPVILTDGSRQKVKVEFYNNDVTKAFRIVLEGVNEIGKMVRLEKVVQQLK